MDEQIACEVAYETGYINGYNNALNALEEFTEKLKSISKILPLAALPDNFVVISDIDNVLKEMIKE